MLVLQEPRPKEPETAMLAGMAAPAPLIVVTDTSMAGKAIQQPARWSYDFDPASGQSRASFPGLVAGVLSVSGFGAMGDGVNDDSAAVGAAIKAADGGALWFPAGRYRLASLVTATVNKSIAIRGAGVGVTILDAANAGGIALTMTAYGSVTISDMTIRNTVGTGGTGLSVSSTLANNGPLTMNNVAIGEQSSTGFTRNLDMRNIGNSTVAGCWFNFPTADMTSVHLAMEGNAAFPIINNKVSNCFFNKGGIGVLIGDGTDSHAQGINIVNSIFVGTNTCVKWRQGSGYLADALQVCNCQLNYGTVAGLDVEGVLHSQLVGNYIFGAGPNQVLIANPRDSVVTGNLFFANGQANILGVNMTGTSANGGVAVTGNSFFGFNAAGAVPVTIGAGVTSTTVDANAFQLCSVFVTDNGSGNMISYTQPASNAWVTGGKPRYPGLQTSAAGLITGDVWRNGTVLNIV
jgi:hypothetical protein